MVLHVKYPSMERQDLSQSQLGAFKFTPVDEEPRPFHQPHPFPLLLDQYNQSLRNAGLAARITSPDIAADPSFFNNQIKPQLDDSRLRLGPAAVRAAVESASTSPHKRSGYRGKDLGQIHMHTFHPHLQGSSENDSMGSIYTDPQSVLTSDPGTNGFPNANSSLLKALESEQEAHENTRVHLEHEENARKQAEAETQRLAEHNKSLLNSIKLLQSTVKHMVQQQEKNKGVGEVDSDKLDEAVSEFKKEAERKDVTDSILYDVLANYKVPKTIINDGQESISIINLDLVNAPDTNDISDQAQLQRTLRRQIGLSSEHDAEGESSLNTEYQERMRAIVQGGKAREANPADSLAEVTSKELSDADTTKVPSVVQAPLNGSQALVNPIDSLFPDLPASFLSKYGKHSGRPGKSSEDESSLTIPKKATITAASTVRSRESSKENKSPVFVAEMNNAKPLNWKVDGRHADELRGVRSQTKTENYFHEHPIRFVPRLSDSNLFRTIMIDFIPFGTPYSDLLAEIRGGTIESVQLYGPIGCATDFVTARVVFTHEVGATRFFERSQSPGIKIGGKLVRVWQILEPTYPKNKELEEDVYQNGHTRLLIVNAPIDDIDQVLKRKLRPQIQQGLILDIGRSYDGVPIVEFTSIEEATKALRVLLDDREFAGSDFDFDEDYCAAKYAS